MRKEYASGNINTDVYKARFNKDRKRFIKELNQFLEENQEQFLPSHTAHIQSLTAKTEKAPSSPKKPGHRKSKVKKTAFDW